MMRNSLRISLAFGALALTATGAFAGSHPIAPQGKADLAGLCTQHHGDFHVGPGTWSCTAKVWTITCKAANHLCIIDLFGALPDGGSSRTVVAAAAGGSGSGGGSGGTGGGFNGVVGADKIDTNGIHMSQTADSGDSNTIVTDGNHHGTGVQLH